MVSELSKCINNYGMACAPSTLVSPSFASGFDRLSKRQGREKLEKEIINIMEGIDRKGKIKEINAKYFLQLTQQLYVHFVPLSLCTIEQQAVVSYLQAPRSYSCGRPYMQVY